MPKYDWSENLLNSWKLLVEKSDINPFHELYDAAMGFINAVNWSEKWFLYLLSFHVLIFTITILTRNKLRIQMSLLFIYGFLAFLGSYFNEIGHKNWKEFATQNYFDKQGLFISLVFSTPLLLNTLFIVLHSIYVTSQALIHLKQKQLNPNKTKQKEKKSD
eukprot:c9152_g1_i1.p1 GENE.c9152_g1_i1~~c9152_g1_i1.p1  ORF type:complete len:161 (+),score=37.42 c9152_g1_i1:25-507(+)